MSEIVQLCGYFALVFAISVGAGYIVSSIRVRRSAGRPLPNATLQIRTPSGVYRSKFLGIVPAGWTVSAPLQRDAYVPIRVGEKVFVVMPTDKGLRTFESEVVLRDSETHELTLAAPVRMWVTERRSVPRNTRFLNPSAVVEGQSATLLDLSAEGAKLVMEEPLRRGIRAAIDLPETGRVFGWVLESSPACPGYVIRLRFEEPVADAVK